MERRVRAADPRDLQEGGRKTRQVDARFILDHEMGGRIQSLAFILLHTFFFFHSFLAADWVEYDFVSCCSAA